MDHNVFNQFPIDGCLGGFQFFPKTNNVITVLVYRHINSHI